MQKHVNLVDLVKSFPTSIYLQNLASIQPRTSPVKFAHLAEKSGKGSISNLSTKVPALIKCLEDREDFVRCSAATALGSLAKLDNLAAHATSAVEALIRCLEDPQRSVRRSAAEALFSVGGYVFSNSKLERIFLTSNFFRKSF